MTRSSSCRKGWMVTVGEGVSMWDGGRRQLGGGYVQGALTPAARKASVAWER